MTDRTRAAILGAAAGAVMGSLFRWPGALIGAILAAVLNAWSEK